MSKNWFNLAQPWTGDLPIEFMCYRYVTFHWPLSWSWYCNKSAVQLSQYFGIFLMQSWLQFFSKRCDVLDRQKNFFRKILNKKIHKSKVNHKIFIYTIFWKKCSRSRLLILKSFCWKILLKTWRYFLRIASYDKK